VRIAFVTRGSITSAKAGDSEDNGVRPAFCKGPMQTVIVTVRASFSIQELISAE
jgi:hypothetical protein